MRTPHARKRWRKIDRALDGSGYSLMLHFTRQGRPDRATLWREYRQFAENWKHPKRGRFFVTTYESLLNVFNNDKPDDDRSRSIPVSVDEHRSTWGDLRVDAGLARLVLELSFGITMDEARALKEEEALEMLSDQVVRLGRQTTGPSVGEADDQCMHDGILDSSDAAAERRRMRRQEQEAMWRDEFRKVLGGEAWFENWSHGGLVRRTWWQSRAPLLDTGGGTTSVSRLAKVVPGVGGILIRRCLQRLACPGCMERGSHLPLRWFSSERGHDFWAWAEEQVAAIDRARAAASRMHGRYQRS